MISLCLTASLKMSGVWSSVTSIPDASQMFTVVKTKQVRMYLSAKLLNMYVLPCLFVPMFCMYFNISVGLDLDFNLSWIIRY